MSNMIFFDVDGTISIEETGEIPESAIKAIRKARENGHLTYINSGRTLSSIGEKYKAIGFDGFVCGCGTAIYENGECIYKYNVPKEVCFHVMQKARETKVTAVYEAEEGVFVDLELPKHKVIDSLEQVLGWNVPYVPKVLTEGCISFEKFCVWLTEEADFDAFREAIKEEFDCIDRGGGMYEMLPSGVSKATGIQRLMEYHNIPLENCYALGDSTNDLSMLQFVPNSIAMGNSMKEILPYCAYQTARVEEDGLAKALAHYGMISMDEICTR